MTGSLVSVRHEEGIGYPARAPFDPPEPFAELSAGAPADPDNRVYALVRQCLLDAGLDAARAGTAEWSPFAELIAPGQTVVIKPNLVLDAARPELQDAVTTHASVIRPLIDYAWKALRGQGAIVVGDAPQAEADFERITQRNGLRAMIEILTARGVRVWLEDFRAIKVEMRNGIWIREQPAAAGAQDSMIVDLGRSSMFEGSGFDFSKLHGGGYGRHVTCRHHRAGVHQYCVSARVLTADAVISVPKLKTHKKAGLTCCLKNLVGINVDKNFLPHFRIGPQNLGGDELPAVRDGRRHVVRLVRAVRDALLDRHWQRFGAPVAATLGGMKRLSELRARPAKTTNGSGGAKPQQANLAEWFNRLISGQTVFQGAWPGNETIWRMILDLNRIFLYAGRDGALQPAPCRKVFYVVDGIIAGERNGPMRPDPLPCGLVAAGAGGLAIDLALLRLLHAAPERIPLYREAWANRDWLMPQGEAIETRFNGAPLEAGFAFPHTLHAPSGWDYTRESQI